MFQKRDSKNPAVFLDRDGTLIHDRGYLRGTEEVCFYKQTVPALKKLQARFELFIVTNQSGVSRGLQTEREVAAVNRFVEDWLKGQGIRPIPSSLGRRRMILKSLWSIPFRSGIIRTMLSLVGGLVEPVSIY